MDFLGLKTLSIIKDAVENIKKSKKVEIDIDNLPLDDKKHSSFSAMATQPGFSSSNHPG